MDYPWLHLSVGCLLEPKQVVVESRETPTPIDAADANQQDQSTSSTTIALIFLGIALLAGGVLILASRGKF